jgi:hypothetical protein
MVTLISEGTRKARKPRQCFHCYRTIPAGETYGFQTCKYDSVYTLSWHLDCEEMAREYRDPYSYADEGWGPLRDDLVGSGQYQDELDAFRGQFPHVVCRMELTDQLRGR